MVPREDTINRGLTRVLKLSIRVTNTVSVMPRKAHPCPGW